MKIAALRAEVVSLRKALARAGEDAARDRVDADAWAALLSERDEAKREVERLRDAVDRANGIGEKYQSMFRAEQSSLAAATALLERCQRCPGTPFDAIEAFLAATTTAPSERAAAERAVLEQAKRFVSDPTLFSDSTLRLELARLFGLDWQKIYRLTQRVWR